MKTTTRHRLAAREAHGSRGDQDARREPGKLERAWGETGFVEIVDVEIDDAVVALVGAEILEVKIAGYPGLRRARPRV